MVNSKVVESFIRFVELLFKANMPKQTVTGEVESVDADSLTCTVLREGSPKLLDVRLNSIIDEYENKLVVYPKVGSLVQCSIIENDTKETVIISYSEIDRVEGKIGATEFHAEEGEIYSAVGESKCKIEGSLITFNKGGNGGLTITPTLQEELGKNNQILQAILAVINGAPALEPGAGNASVLQASLKTALEGKQIGDFSGIENDKIIH